MNYSPAHRSAQKKLLPYLALGIGILSLGFSALFVRWGKAPGPVMAFYRISLSTLILAPFFLREQSRGRSISRALLVFPLLGGLFTALDHGVWNTAVSLTSAANATLLGNTAPLWVALFAWLVWHERLRAGFWAGLALTMLGAAAVLGTDYLRNPSLGFGDVLALLSGLFYAGYFLVTQRGRNFFYTLTYIWLVGLTSALLLLAFILVFRLPLSGYPPQSYLAFLGAALISQTCGYLAVGYALGHLPASLVAPTMIGQPVVTAVLAFYLLGEPLQLSQWLGGLAVLAGIYLVHSSRVSGSSAGKMEPERTGTQIGEME